MKAVGLIALVFVFSSCCSVTARDREPIAAGPYAVETATVDLTDAARGRDVPVRVYAPRGLAGPLPVVVFSHGIGESRDSYVYLGEEWASHGFIAIHITHHGTDRDVLKRHGILGLYRETKKPENWRNRPLDVSFVLDSIGRGAALPLIDGRADMNRIAIAGHSAGVFTALALVGLRLPGGESLRDRRIRTVVAMSLPKFSFLKPEDYRDIDVPILHITGTRDRSLLYWTFPRDRRVAYEDIPSHQQILVTLNGAGHSTFSNPEKAGGCEAHLHSVIRQLSTRFMKDTLESRVPSIASIAEELKSVDPQIVNVETK